MGGSGEGGGEGAWDQLWGKKTLQRARYRRWFARTVLPERNPNFEKAKTCAGAYRIDREVPPLYLLLFRFYSYFLV